ncbi:MAG: SDR family oxidoreductase [Pseudomonadota bacterium]|nr:MAG: SDR family oxidoreductase [Pseudomonadota bacterium]
MNTILITGSNRGLGLEWARQYAQADWRVYATCRYPEQADELHALVAQHTRVTIHQLDVTRAQDLNELCVELGDAAIDVLVNNAGVYFEQWGQDKLGQINYDDWRATLEVNTLGAMRVSEALIDHVVRGEGGLIVAVTSHMGSIADISSGNDYSYRSSKAALNACMKGLSAELAPRGVGVLLLHPGWVRTRMGGASAPLSTQESVAGMREVVESYHPSQSGNFLRYDGAVMPW